MTEKDVFALKAKLDADLVNGGTGIDFGNVAYFEFDTRGWFKEHTDTADETTFEYPVKTYGGLPVRDDDRLPHGEAKIR